MEFVSYELAKKLKEKGFKYICSHYYRTNSKDLFMVFPCEDWNNTEERICAPTISQVLKWLREEKKIVISIFPHPCGWQADIYKDVHEYYDSEAECYLIHYYKEKTEISHSYNWLEIYCIQYVLDNLI